MSSKIKCPKCGYMNSTDLPVCRKCGTPLPVGDELEVIRQVVGASFDPKWALFGGLVILALQVATVFVVMKIEGKEFITGPKRQSLLETTIEGVEPEYGYKGIEEEVKISLRLDQKLRNHAGRVKAVYFGTIKAPPYLKERLARAQKSCQETCRAKDALAAEKGSCDEQCAQVQKLKPVADQCAKCQRQCQGPCTMEALARLPREMRKACTGCTAKLEEYHKVEAKCRECRKKLDKLEGLKAACVDCRARVEALKKSLKRCKPSGEGCFSVMAVDKREQLREELKRKPKREPKEKKEDFERRLKAWKASVDRLKKDISRTEKRTVFVIRPKSPEAGWVPVKLEFSTGYSVSREKAFYFAATPDEGKPKVERKSNLAETATNKPGFWIMVAISIVFYFVGGLLTGLLSPGVTIKEPVTAGIAAGLLYVLFLSALGAEFSVVIFNALVGVPFYAGAAYAGGMAGEKWQGTI